MNLLMMNILMSLSKGPSCPLLLVQVVRPQFSYSASSRSSSPFLPRSLDLVIWPYHLNFFAVIRISSYEPISGLVHVDMLVSDVV